jgi:hypothetical protein
MDLDIKGEIGHLGYVIKLTLVIHRVIHKGPGPACEVYHMRHAVFGFDFWDIVW